MVIHVPNPRSGYVYAEASVKPSHPAGVRYYQGIGYRRIEAKEAVKELGFEDRGFHDGGFIDRANNSVTNGEVVLMESTVENYIRFREARTDRILQRDRTNQSETTEQIERTVHAKEEALQ